MKRNSYDILKNRDRHKPFFLYGMKGVGKTYLCNEYIKDNPDAFIYFTPSESMLQDPAFTACPEPVDFLAAYFSLAPEILIASSMIFDDTEKYIEFSKLLFNFAAVNHCDWIFVSEYNYYDDGIAAGSAESLELFPLQFDEYLNALGFEWYAGALKEHLINKKKLPDILHNEMISDFDEYLYVGGMPQVVNEYLAMKSQMSIARAQLDVKYLASGIQDINEGNIRKIQIFSVMDRMLKNKNQKFKFSEIREGASIKMFEGALNSLVQEKRVLLQREIGSDRNFKLFYPEFSFLSADRTDALTQDEYYLRTQNYIIQTLLQKKILNNYWESGNRASLNLIMDYEGAMRPVNLSFYGKNDLRSIASYRSREKCPEALKIADTNFVDNEYVLPVYMLFGI